MNEDIFAGQWKQMRGELKSWWGRLTDDDLERVGGRKDQLVGLVQEKYGYVREHAEHEVERRLKEFDAQSTGVVASMTAKVQEFGATAVTKANEAATVVGDKIGSMASVIRANVPHGSTVANVATAVGDGLDSASSYLKEKKYNHVAKDVMALVRTYPVQSLVIGISLGYLLARRPR